MVVAAYVSDDDEDDDDDDVVVVVDTLADNETSPAVVTLSVIFDLLLVADDITLDVDLVVVVELVVKDTFASGSAGDSGDDAESVVVVVVGDGGGIDVVVVGVEPLLVDAEETKDVEVVEG